MRKHLPFQVFIGLVLAAVFLPLVSALAGPVDEGTQFSYALPSPDSSKTQAYLGLKTMGPFKVSNVQAKVVVIELMSSTCPHCQAAAPNMNRLYKLMQTDPAMAQVKFFAVALRDNEAGVDTFRKAFKSTYPILLDKDHSLTNSLKGLETPTTIIVSTASGKILSSHPGEIESPDGFLKQINFVKALTAMGQ
ncbi:MAG: TlpA family protein disulfide reductase [Syntrophobacteraceae bacterium]